MKPAMLLSEKAIVSSKGQVVIPHALRIKLGIHSGNELLFTIRVDGVIEIIPVKRSIEMLFGCCKRDNESPMSIRDMDDAIMTAVSEK
ncbi:MAG TPA: AbrB/MazE/SpoVT family DNA-binding domain-containing protein [Gammaproteobacteria bacterium]|nr:AbrB/MazE/SpoVT family DNA-binding domain-containing protein [Gammaproteobacteria bacterium]